MKKILRIYKDMAKPVKASVWYTVCTGVQRSVSFICVFFFTRLLTPEEYGLNTIYLRWYEIVAIFATLNPQYGTFNTAMVKYETDRDRYISSIQSLTTLLTCFLFSIYYCFRARINNLLGLPTTLMIAMMLELLVTTAYGFWAGKKRFIYQYKSVIIVTMLAAIAGPVISVITVKKATENQGLVRIWAVVIVELIVYGSLYLYNLAKGKAVYVKEYWKYALSVNVFLIPYYLSQCIFNQSDCIMIDKICGREAAAIYGMAYNIAIVLYFLLTAINNSLVPWKYSKMKEKDYQGISKVTVEIGLFIIGMLLLLILIAPEVIHFAAPEEYYDARRIVPPVAASTFFLYITQAFIDIEFYYNDKKVLVAGAVLGAVSNITLNWIFIPRFGYVVAGYTTLFSYIIFAFSNYIGLKNITLKKEQVVKIEQIYNIKMLVGMSVIFLLIIMVIVVLYDYIWIRYFLLFIICMIAFTLRKQIGNCFKYKSKIGAD